MESIIYLLKVNFAIVLFYCIYRLLFQQDTFFKWKRIVLFAIIFISFLYPLISQKKQLIVNDKLKYVVETVSVPVYSLSEAVTVKNADTSVNFLPQAVLAVYLLVSGLLIVRLLFQIGTIFYKLYHTNRKVLFGQTVYESKGLKTPFSFFNWIVIDSSQYSEQDLQEILLHETSHVEQMHSIDTILAELMCVFCWFNPVVWLLKKEIRMNLEFLADRSVLSSGCGAEHYQFHLLSLSYHKAAAKITNNFNVSLLKKRIFMMNKKRTSHRSMFKYALILPVVAILLCFNSAFYPEARQGSATVIYQPENEITAVQPNNEIINEPQEPVRPQNSPSPRVVQDTKPQNNSVAKEPQKVFNKAEVDPEYPGGIRALYSWLSKEIVYPPDAMKQGIQGTLYVRFVVRADGTIDEAKVVGNSLSPSIDEEGLRAVKKMPKWTPGKNNGVPVDTWYQIPVVFRISNPAPTKPATDSLKVSMQVPVFELNSGRIKTAQVGEATVIVAYGTQNLNPD